MSNVKVHFAGSDNAPGRICALGAAGVRYRLFTCYPFIQGKDSSKDMKVPQLLEKRGGFSHVILDSGLFTMMFGAQKHVEQTEDSIREWMHRIVRFVKDNDLHASCVECDCQKIIGVDAAWRLRREMRELLPDREIINVFHLPDGEQGFRRLVEFSDYIAIGVPELRIAQPKTYRRTTHAMAMMARKIKPSIKIHLLGCTEAGMLRQNSFCTSADSSSWLSPFRYGFMNGRHVKSMRSAAVEGAKGDVMARANALGVELSEKALRDAAQACVQARWFKSRYALAAGNQD